MLFKKIIKFSLSFICGLLPLASVGCGLVQQKPPEDSVSPTTIVSPTFSPSFSYPGPSEEGYPSASENHHLRGTSIPPNPERDLPLAQSDKGVIGGVLVQILDDSSYMPINPHQLILADIVYDAAGSPQFLRYDDESQRAQTFGTGVFIFQDVPSGQYGLIANLGFNEFPLLTREGKDFIVIVEAGKAQDLGQIFINLP